MIANIRTVWRTMTRSYWRAHEWAQTLRGWEIDQHHIRAIFERGLCDGPCRFCDDFEVRNRNLNILYRRRLLLVNVLTAIQRAA